MAINMRYLPWIELQKVLPELSEGESLALKASIRDHGVLENGVAWKIDDNTCLILDGVHRYDYSEGDMEFNILEDINEAQAFSIGIALNVARRQLSYEQIKTLQETLRKDKEKQRLTALHLRSQGKTQTEVATLVGVTQQAVSEWEKNVSDTNFCNTYVPTVHDLRVSVPKDVHDTIYERYLDGETQKEIAEDFKVSRARVSQIIKSVKKQIDAKTREGRKANERLKLRTKARIKKQDAIEFLSELGTKTVDLLITDPPYYTDVDDIESFVDSWLYLALSTIKDTGQAYIFIGAYAIELKTYLNALFKGEGLRFNNPQILVWTYRNTLGPEPKTQYKQNWQAILYLRGPEAPDLNCETMTDQFTVQDVNAPDGRLGNRHHKWQKPMELAKRLITHGSSKDSFVIDSFAGSGTFLLAAAELGRENLGVDIDGEAIKKAVERGCVLYE